MSEPASRLARMTPGSLDRDQRALYDAIAGGPRGQGPQAFRLTDDDGALEGPFNAFLLQAGLGQALQALGSAVRYGTGLSDRAREVAILVVAGARDCAFERHAHEAVGRHVGLAGEELTALRDARFEALPTEDERTVAATAHALVTQGDLDDERYGRAVTVLGLPGLFELLTLVGYYDLLALQLRVFRVPAPRQPLDSDSR
jgi:4-carboxymuconolactone decarboxylase